jgi:hypothetical protein
MLVDWKEFAVAQQITEECGTVAHSQLWARASRRLDTAICFTSLQGVIHYKHARSALSRPVRAKPMITDTAYVIQEIDECRSIVGVTEKVTAIGVIHMGLAARTADVSDGLFLRDWTIEHYLKYPLNHSWLLADTFETGFGRLRLIRVSNINF